MESFPRSTTITWLSPVVHNPLGLLSLAECESMVDNNRPVCKENTCTMLRPFSERDPKMRPTESAVSPP